MINENPMIVPIKLNDSSDHQLATSERVACHLRIQDSEVTFYSGVEKYVLHAVLAEMSKHAR